MDKNEIVSSRLNTETKVWVNKSLSVRRHGNKAAGKWRMGSAQGVGQDGPRKEFCAVQTVKSSPTGFDLTKYSTSLNFLGVLSVRGCTLQNIVSAACLLIWCGLGIVKSVFLTSLFKCCNQDDCYSKAGMLYAFFRCLLKVLKFLLVHFPE